MVANKQKAWLVFQRKALLEMMKGFLKITVWSAHKADILKQVREWGEQSKALKEELKKYE